MWRKLIARGNLKGPKSVELRQNLHDLSDGYGRYKMA